MKYCAFFINFAFVGKRVSIEPLFLLTKYNHYILQFHIVEDLPFKEYLWVIGWYLFATRILLAGIRTQVLAEIVTGSLNQSTNTAKIPREKKC